MLGLLVAWVLVRYEFPVKRLFDSLIDLPFALPTAVAGLVYSSLLRRRTAGSGSSWCRSASRRRTRGSPSCWCSTFLGLPFVVRAVQPVLETIDADTEEAAFLLGATRWQTFRA